MTVRLGVIMDPIDQINFKKDSTLAMLLAAKEKGWQLYYLEQNSLYIKNGLVKAKTSSLDVFLDEHCWYQLGNAVDADIEMFDILLMRKDPPFDNEYLYSTYLLEQAEKQGVFVVNKPQSLRDCNEKLFAIQFPQCCPPHVVTRRTDIIRAFCKEHDDIILKPLDGMGGASVFRHRRGDPNLGVIIETLTNHQTQQIMVQKYLPEIIEGDKRILLIDGKPIPYALARIPSQGETRGNLAAGGRGEGRSLTDRDYWICEQIAPTLKERGLYFVGIDVIGQSLTEINVTSPTCIRELDTQFGLNIGQQLMEALEVHLIQRKSVNSNPHSPSNQAQDSHSSNDSSDME